MKCGCNVLSATPQGRDATNGIGRDSDTVMITKFVRRGVLLLISAHCLTISALAQDRLIKFYPVGTPKYCKGCGHAGSSFWKLTIRIENISGSDLVLYGRKIDGEFYALNMSQRRNPNVCNWEYGYGESVRRVPWSEMQDYEKVPRVLKAGEALEALGGFDESDVKAPIRYTTFIGKPEQAVPTETYSMPFSPILGEKTDDASFRIIDDVCSPQCKIGISESPRIMGVRLGMPLKDFRALYPNPEVQMLHEKPANYKVAYIWEWRRDAYSVNVTFVDDKVARIEPKFKSLNKARYRDDFWERISSTIGMPYFFEPFESEWKCPEFVVEITPNDDPDITIQTPAYMKLRDQINNEFIKNMKVR